jgi:hypothetical protein
MKKPAWMLAFFVLGEEAKDRTPERAIANDALAQLSDPPERMISRSNRTGHLGSAQIGLGASVSPRKIGFKPLDARAWNNAVIAQKHLNFYVSEWINKL